MSKKITKVSKSERSVTWEEALQGFLFWKQAQGLSKTTINGYKDAVNLFFKGFPTSWGSTNLKTAVMEHMSDSL